MSNVSKIFALSKSFRRLLEKYANKINLISLESFPMGSCGDSALLLAIYLKQHGLDDINYVYGVSCGKSHAWLEMEGLIVDITADQFVNNTSVIVATESLFHSAFEIENRHSADINTYDERTKNQLLAAFKTLIECCGNTLIQRNNETHLL